MRGGRRVNPGLAQRQMDGCFFEAALERCLVSPSSVLVTRGFLETVGGAVQGIQTQRLFRGQRLDVAQRIARLVKAGGFRGILHRA